MKRMSSRLAAAAAALFIFFAAREASAFCRSTTCRSTANHDCATDNDGCPTEGAQLFWPTSCVMFAMNKLGTQDLDPGDTRAVIQKAFRAWTDVPCGKDGKDGAASMTFQERGPVDCKKSEYNKSGQNVNVILFQDDNWNYRGIDGTLAKTSVTYNDETGEIYDSDIEVNAANNTLTITDDPKKIEYDLQAILTHEAGHFIGIAHSPDGNAVMYASYSPGSISQRDLTPDDVEAVCTIYPPNNGVVCNTEPRGGYSPTCDDAPAKKGLCDISPAAASNGTSAAGLAVIALSVIAGVRRRRRP
jgi:MYXO-CTERM domain-containing protein